MSDLVLVMGTGNGKIASRESFDIEPLKNITPAQGNGLMSLARRWAFQDLTSVIAEAQKVRHTQLLRIYGELAGAPQGLQFHFRFRRGVDGEELL